MIATRSLEMAEDYLENAGLEKVEAVGWIQSRSNMGCPA